MFFSRALLRQVASLPAHLAFHWTDVVTSSVYDERRRKNSLRRTLQIASPLPNEAAVLEGLERDGVFITDLGRLGLAGEGEDAIIVSGRKVAAGLANAPGANRRHMITSKATDLLRCPAIYRWGLNAVFLRIAEAYLRQPVGFDGPLVFHTPADGREVGTRRWHLDREDGRMIKVALYLNDVDDVGGPFQILRQERDCSDGPHKYRAMKTAELEQVIGAPLTDSNIVTCTGKAGTLVFADTARFYHRGKPASIRDRTAVFYSYFARRPRHPYFCERSGLTRRQILELIEGLHPTQKASALWRDELPWPARMIPKSLV